MNYDDMEGSWIFLKLLVQCKTCANVLAFGFGDRFAKFKPDSQIENRFAEKLDLSPTATQEVKPPLATVMKECDHSARVVC